MDLGVILSIKAAWQLMSSRNGIEFTRTIGKL